jgi:eukaryotic-like serine/threonine-protein kinase
VKPQNVLIDMEGRAKVTDFGIARSMEAKGLTVTGRVLGTTDYVSPEQALGHPVTEQSDIYSLGIVLYEMLTGDVPFQADTQVAVAMKHVREPLPDVQRRRPEVSAALAAVVERSTAKETQRRYATVPEMLHDLEEVLGIEAARAGETSGEATTVLRSLPGDTADYVPERLRHPRRWLFVSTIALGLVAGLIAYFATRTEEGPGGVAGGSSGGLREVALGSKSAHDYDPESDDGQESRDAVQNAVDHNPTTNWDTETYRSGLEGVGKSGVGLYVQAAQPLAARRLDLTSSTPGFDVRIYASNTVPAGIGEWSIVSKRTHVGEKTLIRLHTNGRSYRNYLVWIQSLPQGNKARIVDLRLWK